ncbi:MAG: hypothetical protein Q8L47_05065 [bacterium]|nr:hypothetical protein [bacterium]
MPDLLKSIKQESEIDISAIKINSIAIAGILISLCFAFFVSRLSQNFGDLTTNMIFATIFGTLFLVIVFLQAILVKEKARVGVVLFLQSAVMLIPFIYFLTIFSIVGFIITFLLLYWGSVSGKNELMYSLKVRIFRISKFILPKAITGLSIFVVACYMSVFQNNGLLVSPDTFKRIILPAEAITKIVMSEFSLNDTFENAILKLRPEMAKFTKDQKTEAIKQQQDSFSKLLQTKFGTNDILINIFYNAYKENIGKVSPNSKILVLLMVGVLLFLIVRSIGTPIAWFVALVSAAIFEILIVLGFATIVLETRSKEIVILK